MTHFSSPAIYQPGPPRGAVMRRGVIGIASCLLAALSWFGAWALAQRPIGDQTLGVDLPPVTITGRRVSPSA